MLRSIAIAEKDGRISVMKVRRINNTTGVYMYNMYAVCTLNRDSLDTYYTSVLQKSDTLKLRHRIGWKEKQFIKASIYNA